MLTPYFIFKILHVISGIVVFCSAFIVPLYKFFEAEPTEIFCKKILQIGLMITLPFLLLQLVTGFIIIGVKPYAIDLPWVWGTFLGFLLLTLSWLFSLHYLAQKNKKAWLVALALSFITLLIMLFLMANRP